MAKYYVDGFTIASNPSKLGFGYTITDESGIVLQRESYRCSLEVAATNNDAEFVGLWKAIELAPAGSTISSDSVVCIHWAERGKSYKNRVRQDLQPLRKYLYGLLKDKDIHLVWERRNFNLAGQYNEHNPHSWSIPSKPYPKILL